MRLGQALVEILIAFGMAALALVGLAQVATKSVSNSGMSQRQSQATSYAVEGVEWLRSRRVALGWNTLFASGSAGGTTYCLNTLNLTPGGCGTGTITGTEYARTVRLISATVTPPPSGSGVQQLTMEVSVSWNEKGIIKSSKQTAILTRY